MRERIMVISKQVYSMVLIVLISVGVAQGSSPANSKKGSPSEMPAAKNESSTEKGNCCEIIACIGDMKDECELMIGVITNRGVELQTDIDESYIRELEKSMVIEFLTDWPSKDSSSGTVCLVKGDKAIYRQYKGESQKQNVLHYHASFRRARKITWDQKIGECDFTYGYLFDVAEALVQQDKAQLGKNTIVVKDRMFKQLPDETFIQLPIIKKPY